MFDQAGIDFIRAELKTGSTLAHIALNSDGEKRERNRVNARKAYDSILHFCRLRCFRMSNLPK